MNRFSLFEYFYNFKEHYLIFIISEKIKNENMMLQSHFYLEIVSQLVNLIFVLDELFFYKMIAYKINFK